jgi:hypothetical protein
MGRLRPTIMEASSARKSAGMVYPPLRDMMRLEISRPRPVKENVPTIMPAAARRPATGSIFLAPSTAASMIRDGTSHSCRSLLRKLVNTVVTIAQMAEEAGERPRPSCNYFYVPHNRLRG